jgi:hypothetical protein
MLASPPLPSTDSYPHALSRPEPSRRALRGWWGTALAATAVTVLNWPGWLQIRPGLDPSWQAGLAVGFTHHLQWGPQLDFTYGPYGFAGFLEPFYRSTAFIAVCFAFVITWALAYLVVAGVRQYSVGQYSGRQYSLGRYPAGQHWAGQYGAGQHWAGMYWGVAVGAVVAWVVVWLSWAEARPADFACVTGLGLALCLLEARTPALRANLAVALGALAGFAVLVKFNSGLIVAGLLIVALVGADGPRRERLRAGGLGVAAVVAVFALAWVAAGQSFANLAGFGRASVSLLVGYGTAMAGGLHRPSIAWLALSIVLVAGLVFASAFWSRTPRKRLAALAMLAGWGWAEVKEGFVSGNHFPLFFRVVLVAVALAALVRPPPAIYAGGLALAAGITLLAVNTPVFEPVAGIRSFGTTLMDIAQGGRFARLTATDRSRLLKDEPLPASALAMLRGRTVAIEPWEDMVAWADPGLRWDPEPVVQSYSAFTPYLDHEDAAFLSSARAPERILYWPVRTGFDSRDPAMDPPSTTEAIFCHYTQLALVDPWQVLGRVPDRCGPAVTVGQVDVHFGQPVTVPRVPGKMVVASFTLSTPLVANLEGDLLKPPDTYLIAWEGDGKRVTYRFVTGTAADDHIVSVPASLGYSAAFTPAGIHRLEISGAGWKGGQGSVKVVFRAMSLAPGPEPANRAS